jgi:hypothetical protein
MGGFTGAAVDIAEAGIRKLAPKIAPKLEEPMQEGLVNFASKYFGLETALRGESGEFIKNGLKAYEGEVKNISGDALRNPAKYNLTPSTSGAVDPSEINKVAHGQAKDTVFGKKREILVGGMEAFRKEHGEIATRNIADQLGVYFHEKQMPGGAGQTTLAGRLAAHPLTKDIKFRPSPYVSSTEIETPKILRKLGAPEKYTKEGFASAWVAGALAPKAGMLHLLGSPFNVMLDSTLSSAGKAMMDMFPKNRAGFRAYAQSIGAMSDLFMEENSQRFNYENGVIKKYLPGSIGEALQGNRLIPGMSFAMKENMLLFGAQGKHRAMEIADDLISGSSRREEMAIRDARLLGLDPNKIKSRGLSPDDMRIAIDANIQMRMSSGSKMIRPAWVQSTPIMRTLSLFHGYASTMRNLVTGQLRRTIASGNPIEFVKTVAILRVIFPDVGAGLRMLSGIAMGKDPGEQLKEAERTWTFGLTGGGDGYTVGKAFADRVEAMAHMIGLGVLSSYHRDNARSNILGDMAGPVFGTAGRLYDDVKQAKAGKPNTALKREILHDIPSGGVGAFIAGHLYPYKSAKAGSRTGGRIPKRIPRRIPKRGD